MLVVPASDIEDIERASWHEVREIALEICLEVADRLAGIIVERWAIK